MKPGVCPAVPPNQVGACVNLCNNDMDCQGAQKCCSNGCGRVCTDITTTGELVTREVA